MQNWVEDFSAAITVTDSDLVVIDMNSKAAATFEKWGGRELVGKNLSNCHKQQSMAIMRQIMETGAPHIYTIEKKGIKKMVFQAPWKKDGAIAGLVEISFEIPWDVEHLVRD